MPAFNEQDNLPRAYDEVSQLFREKLSGYDYEVIVVDNCSTDSTESVCREICTRDNHWRYLRFSRNFTSEISIAAGLRYTSGDAVVILFSDLQDPPDLIPDFVKKWEEGFDIVCGRIREREDGLWWKTIGARVAYYTLSRLTDIRIPENVTDFRLMTRPVVNALNRLDERNRYFRGLAHWVGFKSSYLDYCRRPRVKGESKAPFWYLIDFTVRAWTNFSIVPLRFFSVFGVAVLGMAVLYAAVTILQFIFGTTIPGLTTVYVLLLLILGVLSMGIGTLGEYVGRIYLESKRRPLWVVASVENLEISEDDRYGGI